MRTLLRSCLLAAAATALAAGPAGAGAADPSAQVQVTAVSMAPTVSPAPVLGTDDRVHMPYELLMVNFGTDPATIGSVEALDAAVPARILDAHSGADLAAHFKLATLGGQSPATAVIGPGQEGIVWMDATVGRLPDVPHQILNRMTITYPAPQSGGLIPANVTVTVAPTTPSPVPTPVIAPPLAGPRWFDANGCCDLVTSHRGAVNPLSGRTNFPERTAIDFIRLDAQYRLFTGDPTKLSSYAYYGTPIAAVADGEVIAVRDGLPNQVPTVSPPLGSLPLADFGGNHVIEKFEYAGRTYYAFYAHMAPGSVTAHVHVGEHVHVGQQIGSLGNSGNSSAPHLHFQVMDRPTELAAQGLPYEFDHLYLQGRAASEDDVDSILSGQPLQFAPGVHPGPLTRRMPLNLDLVDFPRLSR